MRTKIVFDNDVPLQNMIFFLEWRQKKMIFFLFRTCSKFLRRYRDRKTGNILRALGRTWVPRKKKKKNVPEKKVTNSHIGVAFFSSYHISPLPFSTKENEKRLPTAISLPFFSFFLFSLYISGQRKGGKKKGFPPMYYYCVQYRSTFSLFSSLSLSLPAV